MNKMSNVRIEYSMKHNTSTSRNMLIPFTENQWILNWTFIWCIYILARFKIIYTEYKIDTPLNVVQFSNLIGHKTLWLKSIKPKMSMSGWNIIVFDLFELSYSHVSMIRYIRMYILVLEMKIHICFSCYTLAT